ncbi:MAG: hypothetical protein KBD76_07885 [Bacteriovorax sp.]|nr:hypothetical protein [Bacteriovorax sp.]
MKKIIFMLLFVSQISFALSFKDGKVKIDKIEEYERCQTMDYAGDFCDSALRDWVNNHPSDSLKAAKLTGKAMNRYNAIYFFDLAFKNKIKVDCKDEDLVLAIESTMGLPENGNEKIMKPAKHIAYDFCFNDLKDRLVKLSKAGGYERDNLCKDLTERKVYDKPCK